MTTCGSMILLLLIIHTAGRIMRIQEIWMMTGMMEMVYIVGAIMYRVS